MQARRIVSRDEWLDLRKRHLTREKQLTHLREEVNRERQALPWVAVEKDYRFETTAGTRTLAELFGQRDLLIVNHFMLAPGWGEGCVGCSFGADHVDGSLVHLEHGGVSFVAVSRAPLDEIQAYKRRMGWTFEWVSSNRSDFNYDFGVSFTPEQLASGKITYNYAEIDSAGMPEELHGMSVFAKDDQGRVYHTYSSYARGAEELVGTFMAMDRTPRGRNEQGVMDWVRRHDEYADAPARAACCSA